MQAYTGLSGNAGVKAFEVGEGSIRLEFADGSVYLYDETRPGAEHIKRMIQLAVEGRGLTTYVNQHVRRSYARRER